MIIKRVFELIIVMLLICTVFGNIYTIDRTVRADPLIQNLALNAPITGQGLDNVEYVNDGNRYTYAQTNAWCDSIATIDITLPEEARVIELYWKVRLSTSDPNSYPNTVRLEVMENGSWVTVKEYFHQYTGSLIDETVSYSSKFVTKARIWASEGSVAIPWNIWRFFELEVWAEIPRPPNEPSSPSPSDGETNVSTNPTLCVNVSDPDGDLLMVSFYEYNPTCFIIDSESEWDTGVFTNTATDGSGILQLAQEDPFGDGSDGDVIYTVDTTLSGDMNYRNLTINNGVTLDTSGYIIRVKNKLENYGTITDLSSGGSGGDGGSGGNGGDHYPLPHKDPQRGSFGTSGGDSSVPTAGKGGDGGAGGSGGGSAWWLLGTRDAEGGKGEKGGDGGNGGGRVMIYANTIQNHQLIHANGFDGDDGQKGSDGNYELWYTLVLPVGWRDLSGGGGGGGEGGSGGDAGSIDLVYSTATIGVIQAVGGEGGSGGLGGSGHCNDYGVAVGNFEHGAPSRGGGGKGGRGEHLQGLCSFPGDPGSSGQNGQDGIVHSGNEYFTYTGYYHKLYDAGRVAHWTSSSIASIVPTGTAITVKFAENSTNPNTWTWYDDISIVPDTQWLKVNISLSTLFHSVTPMVSEFSVSYEYRLIGIVEEVESGTRVCYDWLNLQEQTTYEWFAVADDGIFTTYSGIWTFTTHLASSYCVNLSFNQGWNLISIPVQTGWQASDLLANCSNITLVSWFDAEEQTYLTATSGGGYDFYLECGMGYFVYVSSEINSTFSGIACPEVSIMLSLEWNMLGWYQPDNTTASCIMDFIPGCTMVSWYDTEHSTYRTRTISGGYDFTITRGMGFFVLVDEESEWNGSCE